MSRAILIAIALTMICVLWEPVSGIVWWLSKPAVELARW